jgi:hypothetical protein
MYAKKDLAKFIARNRGRMGTPQIVCAGATLPGLASKSPGAVLRRALGQATWVDSDQKHQAVARTGFHWLCLDDATPTTEQLAQIVAGEEANGEWEEVDEEEEEEVVDSDEEDGHHDDFAASPQAGQVQEIKQQQTQQHVVVVTPPMPPPPSHIDPALTPLLRLLLEHQEWMPSLRGPDAAPSSVELTVLPTSTSSTAHDNKDNNDNDTATPRFLSCIIFCRSVARAEQLTARLTASLAEAARLRDRHSHSDAGEAAHRGGGAAAAGAGGGRVPSAAQPAFSVASFHRNVEIEERLQTLAAWRQVGDSRWRECGGRPTAAQACCAHVMLLSGPECARGFVRGFQRNHPREGSACAARFSSCWCVIGGRHRRTQAPGIASSCAPTLRRVVWTCRT